MTTILSIIFILIAIGILSLEIIIFIQLRKSKSLDLDGVLRNELRIGREESALQFRGLREEISTAQERMGNSLVNTLNALGAEQDKRLAAFGLAMDSRLEALRNNLAERISSSEEAQERRGSETRKTLAELIESNRTELTSQRERVQHLLGELQKASETKLEAVRAAVDNKLSQGLTDQKKHFVEVVNALNTLERAHLEQQEKARASLDQQFRLIQDSNEKKLEQMRQTVDEKLQSTLEKRLGESFRIVSDRLEAVQKGLGEMQGLANGVGDLKRVLTNVRDRGTWGEFQLEAILNETLTPEQFEKNVATKKGPERVEFAIKLPGRGEAPEQPVWLPIDSKFPKEDYEELIRCTECSDADGVKSATRALAQTVLKSAKDIHDKYIDPPNTTDFAIMFLPTEGLYAEVLRAPGLHGELQAKYRVLAAGPTTLAAVLNCLRVGFQTLAIEKQAHKVWEVLSAVKTEFGKFGLVLGKVKKQLNTAANTIELTEKRTRAMERKLRSVEALPSSEAGRVLAIPSELMDTESIEEPESPSDNGNEED